MTLKIKKIISLTRKFDGIQFYHQYQFWTGWNNDFNFIAISLDWNSPKRYSVRFLLLGFGMRISFGEL